MGRAVGIDLGTTYCAVATVGRSGVPEVIRNLDGECTTPSVLYFDGDEVTLGAQAANMSVVSSGDVAKLVKRQMGNADFLFMPDSNDNEYRAEDLSALILARLVTAAEEVLGEEITDVVITVPAYFSDVHRSATKQAGELAGLNVVRLINEPTAAALSFGLDTDFAGTLLVYDLGGGTFDVTILTCADGTFDVKSSLGDRNLGGFDFNNELYALIADKFERETGETIPDSHEQQVMQSVEDTKRRLSTAEKATVFVTGGGRTAKLTVTRDEFEAASAELLRRTEYLVEDAIAAAELSIGDIDKVILVGGSTRMPMVAALVERITGETPDRSVHPDQAVALGAAIIADQVSAERSGEQRALPALPGGRRIELKDVLSQGIGVLALDESRQMVLNVVMPPQTSVPSQVVADSFSTVVDDQQEVKLQIAVGDRTGIPEAEVELLGEAILRLRSGRPGGSPLRVIFSADIDGIIHVQLVDLVDGNNLGEMEVRRPEALSPAEVEASTRLLASARFT